MKALALPDADAVVEAVVGGTDRGRGWLDDDTLRGRAAHNLRTETARELWKYTPVKGFLDALTDVAPAPAGPRLTHADQPGLRVTPIGELDAAGQAALRQIIDERLDAERHPLADLALLRARGGWLVEVTAEVAQPLEIEYPADGIAPVFLRLADHARLTVIERQAPGDGFLTQVLHAELGRGACLIHYRAALQRSVPHYALAHVRVGQEAEYRMNQCCVGGQRRRSEVHVTLEGRGASTDLSGAYLVEDGQHLDQQLVVEHRAGHTRSRQKFHGVGAGKGRSVFNGRIHIHPHAPRSDAELSNKNLALHAAAEMNTKPELEIYTDDVRCAHGATVGRLSDDALFYLRARGVSESEARRLLAYGFVRECLTGPLAEGAAERLQEALTP